MQQRAVARLELEGHLLVRHARHQPQRHAAGPQFLHPAARAHVRDIVPGVGELHLAADRVQHQGQAGDEHVRRDVDAEHVVDVAEDLAGRDEPRRGVPQQGVRARHDQRRGNALVGDVADHEHDPSVRQRDEVVEVTADRPGRAVERGDVPARQVGQLLGQELLLDELGDLQFLVDPLPLTGFGLLLPDQLADPHRRGGVASQRVEQAQVVGRIAALGPPGAQAEQADQAARGDQRHDQDHARGLQRVQRRGSQLQPGDVHRAGRAEQVADQRVVGGQVQLGTGRHHARRDRLGISRGRLRAAQPAAPARRRPYRRRRWSLVAGSRCRCRRRRRWWAERRRGCSPVSDRDPGGPPRRGVGHGLRRQLRRPPGRYLSRHGTLVRSRWYSPSVAPCHTPGSRLVLRRTISLESLRYGIVTAVKTSGDVFLRPCVTVSRWDVCYGRAEPGAARAAGGQARRPRR